MSTTMNHSIIVLKVALAAVGLLPLSALLAHESPIDHVDRIVTIFIEAGRLHVIYRFRCEERQVLLQLNQMDTDRDGKISDEERNAYFGTVAKELTKQFQVEVDGHALTLKSDGQVELAPDLSQTYALSSPIGELSAGTHTGRFSDGYSRAHPGPYRWRPRQINHNGIDVDAVAAPGLENIGPHPAMIVVNLKITVRPGVSSPASTQPASQTATPSEETR